jgi:hypothetical protein
MAQGSISINGNWVPFEPDRAIMLVAGDNRIPTLCYLKGTSPTGAAASARSRSTTRFARETVNALIVRDFSFGILCGKH